MDFNTTSLRVTVDKCVDNITTLEGDLNALYHNYGIPAANPLSRKAVIDHVNEKIRTSFVTNQEDVWRCCRQIKRTLILEYVLDDRTMEPYFDIVSRVQDAVRSSSRGCDGPKDDWPKAVQAAVDMTRISPWEFAPETRRQMNIRDFSLAQAAKNLQDRGYQVSMTDESIFLPEPDVKKLVDSLDELVRRIGGINIANQIFHHLSAVYDPQQERYHLVRRATTHGVSAATQIPFGYLYQLAARHPFQADLIEDKLPGLWRDLIELSRDFIALYDVQTYNTFEVMFKDHHSVIPFLQELAIHDSVFTITQIRPLDSIRILKGVLDWVDWTKERPGGWTLKEEVDVAEAVLTECKTRRGPASFTANAISSRLATLPEAQVINICEQIFAHESGDANAAFLVPTGATGLDFMFRPLFSPRKGEYFLFDVCASAPQFIEAIFSELRVSHKGFDDKVGTAMERHLKSELESHGIVVSSGKYRVGKQNGECDLVIETPQTVIFIEVKKKPLTRQARGGSDAGILLDIAGSMIDAQLQTGRHETLLRMEGALSLVDDCGKIVRIELGNRDVERIALTLLDYGSFQDRIVLDQFLTLSLNVTYSVADPALREKFDRMTRKLSDLRDQVVELGELDPRRKERPFFNCWFISIPQFLILLDGIGSNEEFKKALWSTRHIFTGSLDFYFELHSARRLRK